MSDLDDTTVRAGAESSAVPESRSRHARDWRPGSILLDSCVIESLLGEGGMGRVYKAYHRSWNRHVAVKRPKPAMMNDEKKRTAFETECETWVSLNAHPYVAPCYYVRRAENLPLIFAEYVDGGTLQDWIRARNSYEGSKKVVTRNILDLAIQSAWGLHFAHVHGLVHQDIKPANILLTSNHTAKVTDFGLAKAAARIDSGDSKPPNPMVSTRGMTPAYCSPEQAARKTLSNKSDVWSWAVTVLQLFTRHVTWVSGVAAPYVLDEYAATTAKETGPSLRIPTKLSALLRNCFAEEPDDRPESMAAIAEQLKDIYFEETGDFYWREDPPFSIHVGEPMHAVDLNNRAVSMVELGKTHEAHEAFSEARLNAQAFATIEASPALQDIAYNHLLLQLRTNPLFDVRDVPNLIPPTPDAIKHAYLSGLLLLQGGETERAIRFLSVAVEDAGPYWAAAASARAAALALSGETRPAVIALKDALRHSSDPIGVRRNLALAYAYDGSTFRALYHYRVLATQIVFDELDHIRYATLLAMAGRRSDAARHINAALRSSIRKTTVLVTAAELVTGSQQFLGRVANTPHATAPTVLCREALQRDGHDLRAAVDIERKLERTRLPPRLEARWTKPESQAPDSASMRWRRIQGERHAARRGVRFGRTGSSRARITFQGIAALPCFIVISMTWLPLINRAALAQSLGTVSDAAATTVPATMVVILLFILIRRAPDDFVTAGLVKTCVVLPLALVLPTLAHRAAAAMAASPEGGQVEGSPFDFYAMMIGGLALVYIAREIVYQRASSYARALPGSLYVPLIGSLTRFRFTNVYGPRRSLFARARAEVPVAMYWLGAAFARASTAPARWVPTIRHWVASTAQQFGRWQFFLLPQFLALVISDTAWLNSAGVYYWLPYGGFMLFVYVCIWAGIGIIPRLFLKINIALVPLVAYGVVAELYDGGTVTLIALTLLLTAFFELLNGLSILFCPAFAQPGASLAQSHWDERNAVDPLNLREYAAPWRLIDPSD